MCLTAVSSFHENVMAHDSDLTRATPRDIAGTAIGLACVTREAGSGGNEWTCMFVHSFPLLLPFHTYVLLLGHARVFIFIFPQ